MRPELKAIKSQLLSGDLSIQEIEEHRDKRDAFIPVFTTCRVFALYKDNSVIGYYKEEKYGLFGGAIMSSLAYEMSEILGVSSRLIPSMKMEPFSIEGKQYQGGTIQQAQEGLTFKNYLNHPKKRKSTILKDEYVEALIDSVIIGMFDAHANNILIDSNGNIHFFDLTRSFPHSNAFLDRGGYLSSPYRCDLLFGKESSSIINLTSKKVFLERLGAIKSTLPQVKQYLLSESVRKQIRELPENWFNTEKLFQSLEERIEKLIDGFKNHTIKQARDIAFQSFPYYRLICLLNYCMLLDWRAHARNAYLLNRALRDIELPLFYELLPIPIEGMIKECVKLGLDPLAIKKHAEKESLMQAMSGIVHDVQEKLIHPSSTREMHFLIQREEQLKSELKSMAEIDYKDWGENYPEEDFFNAV